MEAGKQLHVEFWWRNLFQSSHQSWTWKLLLSSSLGSRLKGGTDTNWVFCRILDFCISNYELCVLLS